MRTKQLVFILFILPYVTFSAEYYVDVSRPDDTGAATNWASAVRTIQAAVDVATDGDLIWVAPGTYDEGTYAAPHTYTNSFARICVTKAVTIQSTQGANETVIRGAENVRGAFLGRESRLIGFTITEGDPPDCGGGVLMDHGKLIDCILHNNTSGDDGGGVFGGEMYNCLLYRNQALGCGGGASQSKLYSCTVVTNTVLMGSGGVVHSYLENSIVWGNTSLAGMSEMFFCEAHHTCASSGLKHGENGCIVHDPAFEDAQNDDFRLSDTSPCINRGNNAAVQSSTDLYGSNRVIGTVVDMGAIETSVLTARGCFIEASSGFYGTVSPSNAWVVYGEDLVVFIQPDTGYGVSSLVVDGIAVEATPTYVFTNVQAEHELSVTFSPLSYHLTVENGLGGGVYPHGSVIAIEADSSTNGYGFIRWLSDMPDFEPSDIYLPSTEFTMPLHDVVLSAVFAPLDTYVDRMRPDDSGNGESWEYAKRTIQGAVDITAYGGTVWVTNGVYDEGWGAVIEPDIRIPAWYAPYNRVRVTREMTVRSVNGPKETVIKGHPYPSSNGLGSGGGSKPYRCVYLRNGAVLSGFTLANGHTGKGSGLGAPYYDSGGGVWLSSDCVVSNCIIASNKSYSSGGAVKMHNGGVLANCLIVGNYCQSDGSAVSMSRDATLLSCTVSDNDRCCVNLRAGGIVKNCVVWNESGLTGSDIYGNWLSTNYVIESTCTKDCVKQGGDGCTTNNPQFVDPRNGDYRLQSNSLCINWGDNDYVEGETDLDGNSRVVDGAIDMGAYEYQAEISLSSSDLDGDRIPDEWEREHFGGNQIPFRMCSNGMNTIREAYIAGLNPADPSSELAVSLRRMTNGNAVCWRAVSGRVYSVYRSTNLLEGYHLVATNILWTCSMFTNDVDVQNAYFRIDVRLDPPVDAGPL